MKHVIFAVALALLAVMAVAVILGFAHFIVETATTLSNALNPEGK